MLVSDLIRRIRNSAGDLNTGQVTDEAIYDWINDAIREICVMNNVTQKSASQNTVSGTAEYVLPTDILKLYSVWVAGIKVPVNTLQEWEERNSGAEVNGALSGQPTETYLWANTLTLYPTPDSEYVLKVNYVYAPTEMANYTDELPLPVGYHLRILAYCMAQVALQDDDNNRYSLLMSEFQNGTTSLLDQLNTEEDLYPFISVSARDMGYQEGDILW